METQTNQNSTGEVSTLNKEVIQMNVDEAQGNIRAKASWFFWISGLSLINTFLTAKGVYFIVGLALSQIIDGIVIEVTGDVNYLISLFVPVLFSTFGFFSFRLHRWAFIVGSLVYILDGFIYLYFQEWLAAGFHIFILYKLYQVYKEITEYEKELAKLS
jgi:hypothetical protein